MVLISSYTVDRHGSVLALRRFVEQKEEKLQAEVAWLLSERIDCVLSDAAFLGW
jgi:L-arabinokinase